MNLFRDHFRDYPFRPPLKREKEQPGQAWRLYARFFREYIGKRRWALLLTAIIVGINANYTYMMNAISRYTVDKILVVTNEPAPPPPPKSITGSERRPEARQRPSESLGRRMDRGVRLNMRPVEAGRLLFWVAVAYILSQIFFNTMGRISSQRQIVMSQNILGELREDMHRKILELSLSYHQTMSPGRLLSRVMGDTNVVQADLTALTITGIDCVTRLVVGVIILLVSDWRTMVMLGICMPLYWLMLQRSRPEIRRLQQEMRHTNACLYGLVAQKIDAVKAIQSYHREAGEELAVHRLSSCLIRDAVRVQFINLVMNFKTQMIAHLCNCAVFLYGGWMVMNGQMTLGKMLFVQAMTMQLFQPVAILTQLNFVLQSFRVALGRCFTVLDEKPEFVDQPGAVDFPKPIKHGVTVSNLSFRYPENKFDDENKQANRPKVVDDVSFFVPAGQWLCIMGASGSGKSTLLHLLARLYPPDSGTITFDDTDIADIRIHSLRNALGVVPQEAQIFSGTVRDNIAYGRPNAPNTDIMEVAKQAQMHDFIMEMPVQYETLIGQKGQSLSGGQRQRLSLARALLTAPEVLLLDDCTSALDANTERKIQETLETALAGKTAIMVSQRVSMAVRCHQIAVLTNGRITELGTHQQLLENNGFYAKLYREQTGK